jgi:hypothetical protein
MHMAEMGQVYAALARLAITWLIPLYCTRVIEGGV